MLKKRNRIIMVVGLAISALSITAIADTPAQLAQIFKNVPKLNPKAALATTRVHYIPIPFVPIPADEMPNPQGPAPAYGIAATVAMQNTPATVPQTNTGLPPGGGIPITGATGTGGTGETTTTITTTTTPATCTTPTTTAPTCASGDTQTVAASWNSGTCTWTYPTCVTAAVCSPDTATEPVCAAGQVTTTQPVWDAQVGACYWEKNTLGCAAPTFTNVPSAPAGTATSCGAGYTLSNGYCVANNAYVQAGQPSIGIGYAALDMTNAVYNPTLSASQQWGGTVGFIYGGGAGVHEINLPASLFTGNPGYALNGLATVLNTYGTSAGFSIYVVGGTSIPLTTTTASAPVCPIINGGSDCAAGYVPGGAALGRPVLNGVMLYIPQLSNLEIPIYGEVQDAASSGYLYGGGTSYASTLFSLGITNTQYNLVNAINSGNVSTAMQTACTVNGVFQGNQGVSYAMGTPGETNGTPTFVGGNGCNAISDPGAGILAGPQGQATNIYAAVYTAVLSSLDGGSNTPTGTQITTATSMAAASGAGNITVGSSIGGGL